MGNAHASAFHDLTHRFHSFVLPNHVALQRLTQLRKSCTLFGHQVFNRNACRSGNHLRHIRCRQARPGRRILPFFLGLHPVQFCAHQALFFFQDECTVVLTSFNRTLFPGLKRSTLGFQVFEQLGEPAFQFTNLDLTSRFVEQVDRFVGQEPVGNIAVGQTHGCFHSFVHNPQLVEFLVLLAQATNHFHRQFRSRLFHHNRLEATGHRRVFLNVFTVFRKGRCPNQTHVRGRNHRLQHGCHVHRARCIAKTHHRVDLINKQDDVRVARHLIKQLLQATFKLPTEHGARDHFCKIHFQNPLAAQDFWHRAFRNAARQTTNQRGFTRAWLTNNHRVVLAAAA